MFLSNLQSFLELPIEVKYGCIGKLSLKIPWTNLSNSPVVVTVQDILVVAAPLNHRPYSAEKDEKLEKTRKRRFLQKLEGISVLKKAAKSQNSKVIYQNVLSTFHCINSDIQPALLHQSCHLTLIQHNQ